MKRFLNHSCSVEPVGPTVAKTHRLWEAVKTRSPPRHRLPSGVTNKTPMMTHARHRPLHTVPRRLRFQCKRLLSVRVHHISSVLIKWINISVLTKNSSFKYTLKLFIHISGKWQHLCKLRIFLYWEVLWCKIPALDSLAVTELLTTNECWQSF